MFALLDIYRIRHGVKISSFRLFGYVVFGYAIGGFQNHNLVSVAPYIINTIIIFCGIACASLANDYFDATILGEKNAIAVAISNKHLTKKSTLVLTILPGIVAIVLLLQLQKFSVTPWSLLALWSAFILSILYNVPPFRLKERKWVGLVIPPLGIYLLFIQAAILVSLPELKHLCIYIFVFLFAWYLEFLHLLEDSRDRHEVHKLNTKQALLGLKYITVVGAAISIVSLFIWPVYIISTWAWYWRGRAVRALSVDTIIRERRSLKSSLWHLEDFFFYAVAGSWSLLLPWFL